MPLQFVAKQAGRGSTAVSVESLVDVVRRCAPEETEEFAAALGRLGITSSPLAGGNGFVGFSSVVAAEQSVVSRVAARVNRGPLRLTTLDGPADERERAVDLAFTSRFAIITGGPGTGKTTAVRHLMKCIEAGKLLLQTDDGRSLTVDLAAASVEYTFVRLLRCSMCSSARAAGRSAHSRATTDNSFRF